MIPTQLITVGIIGEGAITNHRRRMQLGRAIGISKIIGGFLLRHRRAVRGAVVHLIFAGDVMDRVIAHRQGVIMHMPLPVGKANSSPVRRYKSS